MKSIKHIRFDYLVPLLILPNIFSTVLVSGTGRSTLVSLFYLLIFAYLLQYKRMRMICSSFPAIIWLTLTVYHLLNAYFKQVPDIRIPVYVEGFRVYMSICIFTFLYSINGKKTATYFYWSLGIWLLLAFINTMYTGYTFGNRLSGVQGTGVIAVEFGEKAFVMAITGIYLAVMKHRSLGQMVLRTLYPLIFVLLAQVRTAFGAAIIQMSGFYYSIIMKAKMSGKQFVKMIAAIVFLVLSINVVLNQSGLGGRIQSDFDKVEASEWGVDYSTGTIFDYVVGERIIYYVTGWEIFTHHPLTGIGLHGYKHFMGGEYPMHVEYMVHMSEGGIIAFALWIIFIISLFVVIIKSSLSRIMKSFALFTMFSILFYGAFATIYDKETVVSLYGLILSISYRSHRGVFYVVQKYIRKNC